MALEFTNIPDREGPAVYLFGDGTHTTETQMQELGVAVDKETPEETQVVYLDPTRGDGLRIKEFYQLTVFPCVLIIMDDDTITQSWQFSLPRAEEVIYALSQINGDMH